ncbi:MAG: hypothetical protein HQK75_20350 [Candidatus Magnetomorum sp.]|nr:hypothetical protein [Candidatus Magnetomorum sp.]
MEKIFKKLNRFFYGKWQIAVLDLERGRWICDVHSKNIPYFKAENANGRHILMKPSDEIECFYLLADDINWSIIVKQHQENGTWKKGRMIIETSPNNFQVWAHSANALSLSDKEYWLQKLCSDPGAHPEGRWGRCPGFRNRKEIYRNSKNQYPLCKLIWVDWKYQANIPKPFSTQPRGGVCLNSSISRMDYIKDDQSATDFSYALALIRRGFTDRQIEERIRIERVDFKNHQGQTRTQQYIQRTIYRARQLINNDN